MELGFAIGIYIFGMFFTVKNTKIDYADNKAWLIGSWFFISMLWPLFWLSLILFGKKRK